MVTESGLLYDWGFTANQFVLAPSPLRPTTNIFSTEPLCNIFSDERMGVLFTIAGGSRQRSHCRVRVMTIFTVSDSRLLQPGGPGPCIYIPQERSGPVIRAGTGFHFVVSYDSQGYSGGIRARLHTVTGFH
jgi:hypothetical protein